MKKILITLFIVLLFVTIIKSQNLAIAVTMLTYGKEIPKPIVADTLFTSLTVVVSSGDSKKESEYKFKGGKFYMALQIGYTYTLYFKKKNFVTKKVTINTTGANPTYTYTYEFDLVMTPGKSKEAVEVRQVYFDKDSAKFESVVFIQ